MQEIMRDSSRSFGWLLDAGIGQRSGHLHHVFCPSDIRVFGGVLDSSELEEYLSYSRSSVPQIDTFHMREVEARSRRKI